MEQKNISFGKGIHRSPSIATSDGELSECVNLIPRGGELVNIEPPVTDVATSDGERISVIIPRGGRLLCVHHVGDIDHYIYQMPTGALAYISSEDPETTHEIGEYPSIKGMQPLGNTLTMIFKGDSPVQWLLWSSESKSYKRLSEYPDIDIDFTLQGSVVSLLRENAITIRKIESKDDEDPEHYNKVVFTHPETIVNYDGQDIRYTSYSADSLKDACKDGEYYIFRNLSDRPLRLYQFLSTEYEVVYPGDKSLTRILYSAVYKPLFIFAVAPDGETVQGLDYGTVHIEDWGQWKYSFELLGINDNPVFGDNFVADNTVDNHNSVLAAFNDFLSIERGKGNFVNPFYVRYAIRLYDNSLIKLSAPMLMIPNSTYAPVMLTFAASLTPETPQSVKLYGFSAKLYMTVKSVSDNWDDWKDLVRGVDIYISPQVCPYDLSLPYDRNVSHIDVVEQGHRLGGDNYGILNHGQSWLFSGIKNFGDMFLSTHAIGFGTLSAENYSAKLTETAAQAYRFKRYTYAQMKEIVGKTQRLEYDGGNIEALATRENSADYENGVPTATIRANNILAYNNRILLAGVRRRNEYVAGVVSPSIGEARNEMRILIILKRDSSTYTVDSGWRDMYAFDRSWMYYPDAGAQSVIIYDRRGYKTTYSLTPHGLLPGAYRLRDFSVLRTNLVDPADEGVAMTVEAMEEEIAQLLANNQGISEPNAIYNSAVNNPFFFSMSQSQTVGNGEIKAISTAAKALSSGTAYGQFPLYCFCTDGVWPLQVNEEGEFNAPNPPTRDVIASPDAVTQMDGLIIFAAKDGLRMMAGEESILLSDVLKGYNISEDEFFEGMPDEWSRLSINDTRSIIEILSDCYIIPDYAHRRIHVYPKTQMQNDTCLYKHYVYAIDDREWSTVVDEHSHIVSVVPGYPASIMQRADGQLIRFDTREDNDTYRDGILLTRPIAFDDPYALKVINDLRMLYTKIGDAKCTIQMYVSNDGEHWMPLNSLRKHAYKWYRFRIRTHLRDTDALTALTVLTETRRTNKIR